MFVSNTGKERQDRFVSDYKSILKQVRMSFEFAIYPAKEEALCHKCVLRVIHTTLRKK
jgi:hypothetical protein